MRTGLSGETAATPAPARPAGQPVRELHVTVPCLEVTGDAALSVKIRELVGTRTSPASPILQDSAGLIAVWNVNAWCV